jgi:hypothetical protein
LQKIGASFADDGAVETQTDSTAPNSPNMYVCYKHRGSGNGKIFRLWFSGASPQEDWYIGQSGIYKENSTYWDSLYDATAFRTFNRDLTTWRRHEIYQYGGSDTVATNYASTSFWIDGTAQNYELYNGGNPVTPNPTGLPCMRTTQTVRNCEFNWPNSTDSGDTQQFADIYQDWTAARVEITFANGKVEIQPCKSWSDTSIEIICNLGEGNSGSATLRVRSASNAVLASQSITVP